MPPKPDPVLMKAIKSEIERHFKDKAIAKNDGAESVEFQKKINAIEQDIKKLEELNKSPSAVMSDAMDKGAKGKVGLGSAKLQAELIRPEIEKARMFFENEKSALLNSQEKAREEHQKFLQDKEKAIADALKEAAKSDLGVSDVKVLKSKVATLEKIVKALMAASRAAAKEGGAGDGVAEAELAALQDKFKQQEKKFEEFSKMKDDMVKEVSRIEAVRTQKGEKIGEKVVTGEPLDPAKMQVVESNLKRLEDDKKLLEDSIKIVQSKQESRKKEIEDAVVAAAAATEAKLEKERKDREKLRAEQLKKMKKETDASIRKAMEDMQKNILESRLGVIEARLQGIGG